MTRSVRKWADDADATLQDCFTSTDWNMLRDSSNGIEEYTISVNGFINKCIDEVIPTVTIRTYPNQNPWITGNIRTELKVKLPLSRGGILIWMLIKNPLRPPTNHKTDKASIQDYGQILKYRFRRLSDVERLANYHGLLWKIQPRAAQ